MIDWFTGRREDSPARIVSGFGGTLCFIVALAYVKRVIALFRNLMASRRSFSMEDVYGRVDARAGG